MPKILARRRLTVQGQEIQPNEEIPTTGLPPLRIQQLLSQGLAYESSETRTMHVTDTTPVGKPGGNGFACDHCGKVLRTPQGVHLHILRVHKEA